MTKLQKNLLIVLDRIKELVKTDEDFACNFADDIDLILNDYHMDDGFGTEGQYDPRGDFRVGEWDICGEVQQ